MCHDINSAMHCSFRVAPTMINHLTSSGGLGNKMPALSFHSDLRACIFSMNVSQANAERRDGVCSVVYFMENVITKQ